MPDSILSLTNTFDIVTHLPLGSGVPLVSKIIIDKIEPLSLETCIYI